MDDMEERIMMTPKGKTANSTTILIERRKMTIGESSQNAHIGGGQHSGIIVNKESKSDDLEDTSAQLQLEFKVFLLNAKTQLHTQESRTLCFWFKNSISESQHAKAAQEFFKELVAPLEFPRDYVGFIKKIMKLMQLKHKSISKLEIELRQLEESDLLPNRPMEEQKDVLTEEKVLESIESAYPNPVIVKDIAKRWNDDTEGITLHLTNLSEKGLIKQLAPGCFTRIVQNETEVQIVRQIPTIASNKQPTIAIITALYCEKLAVDAMIENQETFVRYTTVGESNVYTLGNIGAHRVVCTKLPQVGHDRSAAIAAGNTTTRLLGTFQKVDHVFLVGVAGGVPHFTDYYKHIRLGDIIASFPPQDQRYIYMYCDDAKVLDGGSYEFETKSWGPPNLALQHISSKLREQSEDSSSVKPWLSYMENGLELLKAQEFSFNQPSSETDQLFMSIGGSDVIQVSHPTVPEGCEDLRKNGEPRIHCGAVGSGMCLKDDTTRQDFANRLAILAFDQEFDAVIESVYGNRKDHYTVVRGISDYKDGSRGKEWQPYAALCAAAFTKSIICAMDPPIDD